MEGGKGKRGNVRVFIHIQDAVTKSTKGDIRSIGEVHLQDRDAVDDWCGDGCNDQEDRCGEK